MNLPMDLLRTFVTVIDTGGFTRAGEILGRSQPAISLQVKRLEDMVRTPLLQRAAGQRLQPTEQGEILLDFAHQILRLNDEALACLLKPNVRGNICLGIPNEFAVSFLPEILGKFALSYPNVTLEVNCDLSTHLVERLQEGEFDLIIAIHEEPTPKSFIRVWTEDLVWVTSPKHSSHTKSPLPLIVAPTGCVYRSRVIHTLNKVGMPWRIVYTSPNISGIQAAVLAGLGVTAMARSTVPPGLKTLTVVDKLPELANAQVGLHYGRDRPSQAVLRLVEYITTSLGKAA